MFITVFTRTHHWPLPSARWIQSTSSQPVSFIPTLMFSAHPRLGLTRSLFPSDFLAKTSYPCLSPVTFYMLRPSYPPRFNHSNNIFWKVQMKLLIMQFSPVSCHFLSLKSKYSSEHPVPKHNQSTVLTLRWVTKYLTLLNSENVIRGAVQTDFLVMLFAHFVS